MSRMTPQDGLLRTIDLIEQALRIADAQALDLVAVHLEQALALARAQRDRPNHSGLAS
jgi:translation initiation factor IF-3